jgi:hypothetical protein
MEEFGKKLRKEFIEQNHFLPNEFKPENFYHKSYKDQPSTLSSYSTMLGAYPDSISWIQHQLMGRGTAEVPFTRDEEKDVRRTLGLSDNPNQYSSRDMTIWSETDGRTFFNDPLNNCPQMHRDMDKNLNEANKKYTDNRRFDALYEEMEKTLGVPDNTLTFKNAHIYLDDYVTAQANNRPYPEFQEQIVADTWITNYFRRYYYEGIYGNNLDLSRVASNHFFNYVLTAIYAKYKTARGELNNGHYDHLKYAQFVGNENALIAADKLLNDNPTDPILPPRFGSNIRFELFENGDQYFVKTTIDGKPVKIKGDIDGVLPYDQFMRYLYEMLYFGDVDKYCVGQELASGREKPTFASYEEYILNQNSELRNQAKVIASQSGGNTYSEQKFVEIQQTEQPQQIDVRTQEYVEPVYVQRPQGRMMYNYQGENQFEYPRRVSSTRPSYPYAEAPQYTQPVQYIQPSVSYSQPSVAYSPPVSSQSRYTSPYAAPIKQSQNVEFSNMVETSDCKCEAKAPSMAVASNYNPKETREHSVSIPYLHPVDIPQVIHDTKVVMVPQPVMQVQEKVIREKPTDVHHIDIRSAAPVSFAENVVERSGWPWWWWLPLLLLCCCLPLCCCLLWYFCCRRQPLKPIAKPTPIKEDRPYRKPKPVVKDDEKYVEKTETTYRKKVIDQEKEIEAEIERELRNSRVRKTEIIQEKEKRPIVYHHTRYIERPRYVEEVEFNRMADTATYDAVNRSPGRYEHMRDSYYVEQQRPSRVERVVERSYEPGVRETRMTRSGNFRKSYVAPGYDAEIEDRRILRKTGEGYVSREIGNVSPRLMEVPYSRDVQQQRASSRAQPRYYQEGSPRVEVEAGYGSGRRSGREIEKGYFQDREGERVRVTSNVRAGEPIEEAKYIREGDAYNSNSKLREGYGSNEGIQRSGGARLGSGERRVASGERRVGSATRNIGKSGQKEAITKQRILDDSEDDDSEY